MNNNASTNENKDAKGIALISIGILTILVAIAGATFAFFQVTANATFTGNSAYVANPLSLTVTHETASTVGTKKLIPLVDTTLQTAVTGYDNNGSCLDVNENAICQVYSITIENLTTTNYYVSGTLTFTTNPATTATTGMPNLKWAKGNSATSGFPTTTGPFFTSFSTATSNVALTTQTTNLTDTVFLTANGTTGDSKTFYIAVWISETGAVQNDSGTFTGTVSFTGYSDQDSQVTGITSTIRSAT